MEITELLTQEGRPSDLLLSTGAAQSRGEAKRLIRQGAVDLRDHREATPVVVKDDTLVTVKDGMILHVGKRFWFIFRFPRLMAEVHEFISEDDERVFLDGCPHISQEDRERTLREDWG